MDGNQSVLYFELYKALVGAAYVQHQGRERSNALGRAWSSYARPLIDLLWDDDSDPKALQSARRLIGWLGWLGELSDPEAFFRATYTREILNGK